MLLLRSAIFASSRLGNILDGGNSEKGRARVSAKPSGPAQASPVSKNRLHPRQTWNYPPPATPASSARKRYVLVMERHSVRFLERLSLSGCRGCLVPRQ